ncbi:MAG: type III PLP-dependent enzyme [Catenulispora sp.]|nr:type III PLP-dependent enzyme [Catenulispora sp.]
MPAAPAASVASVASAGNADPAADYGTPRYVYDLDDVTAARDSLLAVLPEEFDVFYAVKANPHPDVAGALRTGAPERIRAEISSVGELSAALAAGYAADRCLYTGPGKTDGELDDAIGRGVRLFSVESPSDLRHVGAAAVRHGVTVECLLRINTTESGASTGVRMMGKPSQFGLDAETLPALMPELTRVPGARVVGAHFFTMSNARDEDGLLDEYGRVVELAARLSADHGLPLEFLDIGGGFASPYAVPGERAEYPKLRAGLERLLDLHLPRWRTGTPHLSCESGRYLVGGCGALVSQVVNVKESRGRGFVILDAGINAVGGLSGLGRLLPMAAEVADGAATGKASLVGPLCTPGDTLGRDVPLPDLAAGDTVTIPNVGAYGVTASLLGFLGRPAPVEVAVRDGRVVSATRLELHRTAVAAGTAGAAGTAETAGSPGEPVSGPAEAGPARP